MAKVVLSLCVLCLCWATNFAQTQIAYCDLKKVLVFMPEIKEMQNTLAEYEIFFAQRMEEKERAYEKAFKEYIEFAKSRAVNDKDEEKVALENEVVALHNEVKYLQEQIEFARKKIPKDAENLAEQHLIRILKVLAKEEGVQYVLNAPFLFLSQNNIDLTNKAIERALLEESGTQVLLRGAK